METTHDVDTLVEVLKKVLEECRTFRHTWRQRAPDDPAQMALRTVLKRKVEDPISAILSK